jgi:hypothetical protein
MLAAGIALAGPGSRFAGYAPPLATIPLDTARHKSSEPTPDGSRLAFGAVIPGYLSSWGLPPVQGQFTVSDTGLVFRSARGSSSTRASTLSLGYVDHENGRAHYVFRIDDGVFETDAPGILLEVLADPVWLKDRKPGGRRGNRTLVKATDPLAPLATARQIAASSYADSLYRLFGQPSTPVGLIGRRGRRAGRLGEYIAGRDSLALDPSRMVDEAQLRHALAHELGHRWQARAKAQVATLWSGVPSIPDPKRYGFGEPLEHQAEAVAFAVNFLQTTAAAGDEASTWRSLLDHYELLVPGTRIMVRYLSLQPIYRKHPLRSRLTTARITSALEQ